MNSLFTLQRLDGCINRANMSQSDSIDRLSWIKDKTSESSNAHSRYIKSLYTSFEELPFTEIYVKYFF